MPNVSVIIPVYNVESYLRDCLESVVSQTLEDVEIVCVNDGSSDGSAGILADFAARDSRIVVIEQENRGLSAARNAAVSGSHGDYIHFLDADDLMDASGLERLHERASREKLDVLYFDAAPFYENAELESEHETYKAYYTRSRDYPGVMTGAELLTQMVQNRDYRPSACLQLIRREFYTTTGLSFRDGALHEDNPFTFVCALQAQRVGYEPQPFYRRRIREGSISTVERGARHFHGFFVGYLEMLRFAVGGEFDARVSEAIAMLLDQMYRQALKRLAGMTTDEREAIKLTDSSPEALLTYAQLAREADELLKTQKAKKKLRDTTRKLEAIRNSRSYKLIRRVRKLFGGAK